MYRLMIGSVVILILTAGPAAQQARPGPPITQPQATPDMKACHDAMARHGWMMEQMQAMDARLQEQVKAMQVAQGQARVDAIARVVTTIVEQRTQMHQRMMSTHEQMASHMTAHAGQSAAATQQCPMMQHMMKGTAPHQH